MTRLALVLLLAVSHVNWNSRTSIFRAFYAIQPGMTVAQVDHLMDPPLRSATAAMGPVKAWHPKTEPHPYFDMPRTAPPANVDTLRYRPWDCADIFTVHFVDGRVIERSFSPD